MAARILQKFGAVIVLGSLALACGTSAATDEEGDDSDGAKDESAFSGSAQPDIGQFFMIEHFGVEPNGYADVHSMIKQKNLGALILWNPQQATGETARQMVTSYAASAQASHHPELFVAADQEERGTQRFKSRHGFTDLVDAATLGRVVAREGNAKVCELHARITSREMASAGLNMTLGTVSDIYTKDSGTPGMFRTRSVGTDANVVASCIKAMTKAYGQEGHVVFITKHFPGLGNASGNTDVDPSVRSYSTTREKMENELAPYRGATAAVNADGSSPLFGAMVSHASYEILDSSKAPATLSSVILDEVLRNEPSKETSKGLDKDRQPVAIKGMDLKGLAVSDAFWTWGAMKDLSPIEKRRLMARSFLAGMDILMIAKADFAGAWDYFQSIYASQLPAEEQAALVRDAKEQDWASLVAKFRARVATSAERVKTAKTKVGPASGMVGRGEAKAASTDLVDEYKRLTAAQ